MTQFRNSPDRLKAMKARTLADSKEFSDAAMKLDIDAALTRAGHVAQIGAVAAHMAGESIQRVGDRTSEGVINGAYGDVNNLMKPVVKELGPEAAAEVFSKPVTIDTIQGLAGVSDDKTLRLVIDGFARKGKHLQVTNDGLVRQPDFELPGNTANEKSGCPMAKNGNTPYFKQFTARAIETYSAAYLQNMPVNAREHMLRMFR